MSGNKLTYEELEQRVSALEKQLSSSAADDFNRLTTGYEYTSEIVVIAQDDVLIFANNSLCSALGYKKEALIGCPFLSIIAPECHDAARGFYSRILDNQGSPDSLKEELKLLHNDGRTIEFEVGFGLLDYGEKPAVLGFGRDITDRKSKEASLIATTDFLNGVIDEIPFPMAVKDEDHRWVLINKIICSYFLREREELIGKTDHDFIPKKEADIFRAVEKKIFETGKAIRNEEVITSSDGARHYQVAIKAPFRDDRGKKYILCMSVDNTEQRHAEIEKDKLQQQLVQSQKLEAIGMLAGGIAHEFNNLLAVIVAHASMGIMSLKKGKPVESEFKGILDSSKIAKTIVKQLLTFAQKNDLQPTVISSVAPIKRAVEMLRRTYSSEVKIILNLKDPECTVEADPNQIEQAIINLCNNARDAMGGQGTITIDCEEVVIGELNFKEHDATASGYYCRIRVCDSGPGIPEEDLEKIFEPFFSTKETGHGTGLGLAVTRGIIDRHHGWIIAKNTNSGTCFSIYLPHPTPDGA